jgi:hypothetical protein
MSHLLLPKLKRHPRGPAPVALRSVGSEPGVAASPGRSALASTSSSSPGRTPAARPSWSSLRALAGSVRLGGNALDDVERLYDG